MLDENYRNKRDKKGCAERGRRAEDRAIERVKALNFDDFPSDEYADTTLHIDFFCSPKDNPRKRYAIQVKALPSDEAYQNHLCVEFKGTKDAGWLANSKADHIMIELANGNFLTVSMEELRECAYRVVNTKRISASKKFAFEHKCLQDRPGEYGTTHIAYIDHSELRKLSSCKEF